MHTRPLEEVICHELSHIYRAETGGTAHNARLSMQLLRSENGKITAEQVAAAIQLDRDWLPRTSLVVVENTANIAGGAFYTQAEMQAISTLCLEKNIKLHLDGARIFNALAETHDKPHEIGALFDSISVCLSKGLGAPVGSLLVGSADFIKEARRFRKAMGGGMRQAGFLAAAGIYALDNHVLRLTQDHAHARILAQALAKLDFVENIRAVQTNIVIFDVKKPLTADIYLAQLAKKGIKAAAFGPQTIRFVTHLDFTNAMLQTVLENLYIPTIVFG